MKDSRHLNATHSNGAERLKGCVNEKGQQESRVPLALCLAYPSVSPPFALLVVLFFVSPSSPEVTDSFITLVSVHHFHTCPVLPFGVCPGQGHCQVETGTISPEGHTYLLG